MRMELAAILEQYHRFHGALRDPSLRHSASGHRRDPPLSYPSGRSMVRALHRLRAVPNPTAVLRSSPVSQMPEP